MNDINFVYDIYESINVTQSGIACKCVWKDGGTLFIIQILDEPPTEV